MTVAETINILLQMPPDARLCEQRGSEYFDIVGLELKRAYQGSQANWLYSSVEFPEDYNRTQVVKVCRKKRS